MDDFLQIPVIKAIIGSVVYSGIGLGMFVFTYRVVEKLTPFSLRKEIEEDQNIAVGVMMGAVMLGLAIIIAAAIHG